MMEINHKVKIYKGGAEPSEEIGCHLYSVCSNGTVFLVDKDSKIHNYIPEKYSRISIESKGHMERVVINEGWGKEKTGVNKETSENERAYKIRVDVDGGASGVFYCRSYFVESDRFVISGHSTFIQEVENSTGANTFLLSGSDENEVIYFNKYIVAYSIEVLPRVRWE